MPVTYNRRDCLKTFSALGLASLVPWRINAADTLPRRLIPGTEESLPVIGLGSSKPVMEIPDNGTEPLVQVIDRLVSAGGSVVDTSPREEAIDRAFGQVLQDPRWRDILFVSTKVNTTGKENGIRQMQQTSELFGKDPVDLINVESMQDLETHWPGLRARKENGKARYIGATVARIADHERMEAFMKKETPDFVQINFSVAEPQAEQRLLPLAADLGIAVQINRPFMNGSWFQRTRGRSLPAWAAEFDCDSWAQFSLKYILANPSVTCVLTETGNPVNMADNLQAAFGRLPDPATLARMKAYIANF